MVQNQAGFSPEPRSGTEPLDGACVRAWFEDPVAVAHYARAAASLGLWRSETVLCRQVFAPGDRILDIGCGAGRIALGLWGLGFARVAGCDFSRSMIAQARELAAARSAGVSFHEGDACALPFAAAAFDGAIFGFNGLMQIPGRSRRRQALAEAARVVAPGGRFIFTTHDREAWAERSAWQREAERWRAGTQDPALLDFGDRVFSGREGRTFIHQPDRAEVLEDLVATGWTHLEDRMRSELANEGAAVREFSDECRFWIARRP